MLIWPLLEIAGHIAETTAAHCVADKIKDVLGRILPQRNFDLERALTEAFRLAVNSLTCRTEDQRQLSAQLSEDVHELFDTTSDAFPFPVLEALLNGGRGK